MPKNGQILNIAAQVSDESHKPLVLISSKKNTEIYDNTSKQFFKLKAIARKKNPDINKKNKLIIPQNCLSKFMKSFFFINAIIICRLKYLLG